MEQQDEYVPLFPLLADYWDKPFSELPEALQARVSLQKRKQFSGYQPKLDANGELECDAEGRFPVWEKIYSEHEVGDFIVSWDRLSPEERRQLVTQIDNRNDPALAGERHVVWHDQTMDARRCANSGANWTRIPRQTGQPFQSKLDSKIEM